jgi:hypothetical protein
MNQPSLFAAPASDDAAWLAQVRADAGRWWASTEREKVADTCPLLIASPAYLSYAVWMRAVFRRDGRIGRNWSDVAHARLWLWLALGIVPWHLVPDVATARWEARKGQAA